ncbi:hypothetical protein LO771_21320 [Streptacidiphilus sp. ASG 303]|uniref:hypothetical protein n=1 Tax=Streptacidiphilus sp. ASG 303 TaxID=2896847 RepID=UPI001E377C92|nr:hypothetical protein [Streptacidiphilus sp. ASG 303]MCD0484861.1 hypothetical protein [Streptacidiphilus sp. ASG 303]
MGTVGSGADSTVCKSLDTSLRREALRGGRDHGDPLTCRRTVLARPARDNTHRRHSADGCLSRHAHERRDHPADPALAA